MAKITFGTKQVAVCFILAAGFSRLASAAPQQPLDEAGAQPDRIAGRIDPGQAVVLKGNVKWEAQPQFDQGPADSTKRIDGITLVLKPSPSQQAALEKLLVDQQDASSPDYHNWLTPQQYADRFGASGTDMAKIAEWLTSEGFSIDNVAQGRNWILFSGTAGQVRKTFSTEIHIYRENGETHYANPAEPSVPAALEPLTRAILGLDDFHPKPKARQRPASLNPMYTFSDGSHALTPTDIGTIYDIAALWTKGTDGTGQKIAVIGQTDIKMADIDLFRNTYGLPKNDPQKVLVAGKANPGVSQDELSEANLDLDWAGAIAPNATVLFVFSNDSYASAFYAIDQNLAPVISDSYGWCEPKISSTPAQFASVLQTAAQQANSQGITWVAAAGDAGAADCNIQGSGGDKTATYGLAVDLPGSVPEVTSVGGTEFNEGPDNYWKSSNGTGGASVMGYIPEMAWNDSSAGVELASSGGGASIFFAKPVWQKGPGVPNDGHRDVPDLSFSASWDHDGYWIAINGKMNCCWGGTSIAAPTFAGVVTLLNQYQVSSGAQSKPGLGNINPTLYTLGQTTTGIFNDITVGSNIVPCTTGTPDCSNGSFGYSAGPGYDQVTGLGSVDVYKLVTQWSLRPATATTTTVGANPASLAVTASTNITATVKATTGTATPTGSVSFSTGSATLGDVNLAGSGGTATASIKVAGNQLTTGNNTIKASYSGDKGFNPSSASASVTVTVPTTASAVIPSVTPNPVYEQKPDADGYAWFYKVKIAEIAGVATTVTAFSIDGRDYTSSIVSFFGTAALPANGTLSASLKTKLASVPVTRVFAFSGVDASGAKWNQQISVPFYGPQLAASMVLSSSPAIEVMNPNTDFCTADYPYYQELNLQEKNGYEVYLTKFFNGGTDSSHSIEYWFGSWRLAPLGSLQAGICWALDGPQTLNFEVDGIDSYGNKVTTTLSVPFQGAAQNPGKLSVSRDSLPMTVNSGQSTSGKLQVSVPAGQQWTLSVFPANQRTSWLTVTPLSGTGASTVSVTASGAGLANGAYVATLVFQSVNTVPQFVNVPVIFSNGLSSTTTIGGVAHGASFQQNFAPGMILSVFGTKLTNSATPLFAPSVPLPYSLGGVTANVNGVPAPFYYAGQGQLNIQVPYEIPVGDAILNVNNNGQVAAYSFYVSDSAPGIFVGAGNTLVPAASGRRGQTLMLFMTGEGDVAPFLATGATPDTSIPVSQLPQPRLPYSLTVAGLPVTPDFIGIPYGLVGATQINFTIPRTAPLGAQQVVVTVGDNSSVAAMVNITQ